MVSCCSDDLPLFFRTVGFRDIGDLRFDAHGRRFGCTGFFLCHDFFASDGGDLTDLAVFPNGVDFFQGKIDAFEKSADPFDELQPGHLEEKAEAQRTQEHQYQGAAGKAQIVLGHFAYAFADDSTRNAGQGYFRVVHAKIFDA